MLHREEHRNVRYKRYRAHFPGARIRSEPGVDTFRQRRVTGMGNPCCSAYDTVLHGFTVARHRQAFREQVFQLFCFNRAVRQYLCQQAQAQRYVRRGTTVARPSACLGKQWLPRTRSAENPARSTRARTSALPVGRGKSVHAATVTRWIPMNSNGAGPPPWISRHKPMAAHIH